MKRTIVLIMIIILIGSCVAEEVRIFIIINKEYQNQTGGFFSKSSKHNIILKDAFTGKVYVAYDDIRFYYGTEIGDKVKVRGRVYKERSLYDIVSWEIIEETIKK